MIMNSSLLNLTKDNFRSEVLEGSKPVLIDFWAAWCGPCRMMKPAVAEAATLLGDKVQVAMINVDEEPELAEAFGIRGIPTLVLIQGNKVLDAFSGFRPAKEIVNQVERHLPAA